MFMFGIVIVYDVCQYLCGKISNYFFESCVKHKWPQLKFF